MRRFAIVLPLVLLTGFTVLEITNPAPVFIWNHTASIDRGLYLYAGNDVELGVTVAVSAPPEHMHWLNERGLLPENVLLMKQVVAVSGDQICRISNEIFVRGDRVAAAHPIDSNGNPLPHWRGCQLLQEGEFFILGTHPDSLDGRYFGPVHLDLVIGTYRLIWRARS